MVRTDLHLLDLLAAANLEKKIAIGNRQRRIAQGRVRDDADSNLDRVIDSVDLDWLQVKPNASLADRRAELNLLRLPR